MTSETTGQKLTEAEGTHECVHCGHPTKPSYKSNGKWLHFCMCKVCDHLWHKYRIRRPERDALLEQQGGNCAICGDSIEFSGPTGAHVDHCHDTGRVRGILCSRCNTVEGMFKNADHALHFARRLLVYLDVSN